MAYHFSANQFEDQYSATKLGNWEYPKWFPERPRQRFKSTKIIADDNGRLLDGVKRGGNAWGNYVGTWDLPRRITRDYVKKLVAPDERLIKRWSQKKKETVEVHQEPTKPEEKYLQTRSCSNSSAEKNFERRNKSSSALDLRPSLPKLTPLVPLEEKKNDLHNIKAGVLDETIKNIFDSVTQKQEDKIEGPPDVICKEIKAVPKSSERRGSDVEREHRKLGYLKCLDSALEANHTESDGEKMEKSPKSHEKKESLKKTSPSYQIAKRFHDENLRHKPLPDVVADPIFKALANGGEMNQNEILKIDSGPSAIGWKPYSAPRPTECSKMKVFRPKTAVDKAKPPKDSRPKTSDYKKRFLPIDLAICWDLKPEDPSDEPKRSPHIDGSNGSVAPAVFTMIKPSLDEDEETVPGTSQAVAEKIIQGIAENNAVTLPSQVNGKPRTPLSVTNNREAIMSCVRSPQEEIRKVKDTPDSSNSISPNAAEYARKNPKTAWTNEDTSKALSDRLQSLQNGKYKKPLSRSPLESLQTVKNKHHQSTPNLTTVCDGSHCGTEKNSLGSVKSIKSRLCGSANMSGSASDKCSKTVQKNTHCFACKNPNSNCDEDRPREEFKSAFKAGVPKSESSNSGSSSTAKSYKVPKMRLPYAKRSYSIGTLVPPFSIWRESNGQEYPEHWRLASVYQHSYKPVNNRRRPLLASVYQ